MLATILNLRWFSSQLSRRSDSHACLFWFLPNFRFNLPRDLIVSQKRLWFISEPTICHSLWFPTLMKTFDRCFEFNYISRCTSWTSELLFFLPLSSIGSHSTIGNDGFPTIALAQHHPSFLPVFSQAFVMLRENNWWSKNPNWKWPQEKWHFFFPHKLYRLDWRQWTRRYF